MFWYSTLDAHLLLTELTKRKVEVQLSEQDEEDLDKQEASDESVPTVVKTTTMREYVRLATVDNFQGEESNVVIISLVRSNPANSIGFLKISNRVNVLLTRAKKGMFIFGNAAGLEANPIHRRSGRENPWLRVPTGTTSREGADRSRIAAYVQEPSREPCRHSWA